MYGNKEKIKHLRALYAENHAEVDLELLKKHDPRNQNLILFEHSPKRNAEKILFTLLDFVTAEEIRNNRRKVITLENTEEEIESLEIEKQDLVDKVEELTEKHQKKGTELKAEKKSELIPEVKKVPVSKAISSKKKRSTPRSSGKTSKTKTSK
jgi:hypothetical protein